MKNETLIIALLDFLCKTPHPNSPIAKRVEEMILALTKEVVK